MTETMIGDVPLKELAAAARLGDPMAQTLLGDARRIGVGDSIAVNDAKAAFWYRRAAAQGQAEAQDCLGVLYLTGHGVPQDDVEAARWFLMAARQGYVCSQHHIGVLYMEGRGVAQDNPRALGWFLKAARQGWRPSQVNAGWMYAHDVDIPCYDDEPST
ncbi:MAG: sel1 repeat family protein [Alphaproteobacteria bacterium]|nr:sel1 repeat family protein [Alphaproteobacteria bacterium]